MKRIISIFVFVLMIFLFAGCGGLINELTEYKQSVKEELEIYVNNKCVDNYSEENWLQVEAFLSVGKTEIDEAINLEEINTSLENTKENINNVPLKTTESPDIEKLDLETEIAIRESYLEKTESYNVPKLLSDFIIMKYYGTYNGYVVVQMHWVLKLYLAVPSNQIVGGISINHAHSYPVIEAWKDGVFYDLQKLYEEEILTKENIQIIALLHNGNNENTQIIAPINNTKSE